MLQKNGLQRIQKKCQWVSWEISCMIQKRNSENYVLLCYRDAQKKKSRNWRTWRTNYMNYIHRCIRIKSEDRDCTQRAMSKKAWKVVNKITSRKGTKKVVLKANRAAKRTQKWKGHFYRLLGKPVKIAKAEIAPEIDGGLPINTEDFTLQHWKTIKPQHLTTYLRTWKREAIWVELMQECAQKSFLQQLKFATSFYYKESDLVCSSSMEKLT